jgi:hypothetical protein
MHRPLPAHRTLNCRVPPSVTGSEAAEGSEKEALGRAGRLGVFGPVRSPGPPLMSKICKLPLAEFATKTLLPLMATAPGPASVGIVPSDVGVVAS